VNISAKPSRDIDREPQNVGRPALLIVLGVLITAEGLLMAGVAAWLLVELLTTKPVSLPTAVAITVLAVLAAIWVLAIAVGTFRARPWIRGAAITWQLIQIAIAVGCFEGFYAEPALGWALLVPSLVVIGLVVTPSVTRVTKRVRPDEDLDATE
jgi:hypothetical protein